MAGILILTHGLIASGKSTWARKEHERDPENIIVVERDELRSSLFGEGYHKKDPDQKSESQVSQLQQKLIKKGLAEGKTVIVSDTNLNHRFLPVLTNLAKNYNAKVEQQYFNVPIEECKRRNRERGAAGGRFVPEHIIDRMAKIAYDEEGNLKEFRLGEKTVFIYDRSGSAGAGLVKEFNEKQLRDFPLEAEVAISVDMDGTLADMRAASDRSFGPGVDKKKAGFPLFHKLGKDAPVNQSVLDATWQAREAGINVIGITGRSDEYAYETITFLERIGAPISKLYMRKSGDYRSDYEMKKEILEEIRNDGQEIIWALDDNPKVLRMWGEEGIPVTVVPWHEPQEYNPEKVYEPIEIASPFASGSCIRCGSKLKDGGTIGPKCKFKSI